MTAAALLIWWAAGLPAFWVNLPSDPHHWPALLWVFVIAVALDLFMSTASSA